MKESNKTLKHNEVLSSCYYNNEKSQNLLLIHGFLGCKEIWDPMIEDFSEHFNVLTIDLPGHGQSRNDSETLTMLYMAELVINVLQSYQISRAHFVGHSMGGYVSLEILSNYPEHIESLTLLNSTAKGDSEQKRADRLRAVRVFDLSPKIYIREAITNLFDEQNLKRLSSEIETMQEMALQTSPKGAQACLRGMRLREDYSALVNNTSTPVQYLSGVNDTTVPYDSIVEQIKNDNIQLVPFEKSGHMSFVEEKELCVNSIINFIKSI